MDDAAHGLFEHRAFDDHEAVTFANDGLIQAIVAVHSTARGPALGGLRWRTYPSSDHATHDALRLARAMTLKAALADLPLGGGKAVLMGPRPADAEPILERVGELLNSLAGTYITAPDVGTSEADMNVIRRSSPHVVGVSPALGGTGDPSPATARGVVASIEATCGSVFGDASLDGRRIVVSGVGKVGSRLVRLAAERGATMTIADVDQQAAHRVAAEVEGDVAVVAPDRVHAVECDVFAPCALGGVLHDRSIPELACRAVVGAANNQLADPEAAAQLAARGILYVPDYVVNAGGLVQVGGEHLGLSTETIDAMVDAIGQTIADLIAEAAHTGRTTLEAAESIGRARLAPLAAVAP